MDRQDGPPRVVALGRRLGCANSRFEVFLDHVADPATGTEVRDFLVVAPRGAGADLLGGVVVVPVWQGRVVLLRIFRHPVGREVLAIPGGFVESGEDPAAAALRELAEETGLVCPAEALVPLGFCYPEPGVIRARVALFAATGCRPDPALRRDAEEVGLGAMVLLPVDDLHAALQAGTIEDSTSALALHRYLGRGEYP